jgi:integrase/recombinase XerD
MQIKYLKKDKIAALLNAAACTKRDYLMLTLGYQLGLRASEIISLQRRHFDVLPDKVIIVVDRLKGSKQTTDELLPETAMLAREYLAAMESAESNAYLFTGNRLSSVSRTIKRNGQPYEVGAHLSYKAFWELFRKYCRIAGISTKTAKPHSLKHSSAMAMLPEGGVKMVQEHLGHVSGASSMIYLSVTAEELNAARCRAFAGTQ